MFNHLGSKWQLLKNINTLKSERKVHFRGKKGIMSSLIQIQTQYYVRIVYKS